MTLHQAIPESGGWSYSLEDDDSGMDVKFVTVYPPVWRIRIALASETLERSGILHYAVEDAMRALATSVLKNNVVARALGEGR